MKAKSNQLSRLSTKIKSYLLPTCQFIAQLSMASLSFWGTFLCMQFIVLFLLTIMISPIVTAYHFAVFAAMIVFGYGISLLCGNIMYPKLEGPSP